MARSSTFGGHTISLASKLSPTQRRALQTSWKHMSHNGGIAIMERIFQVPFPLSRLQEGEVWVGNGRR